MPTLRWTAQIRDVTDTSNQITIGKSNVSVTTTGDHEDRRTLTIGTSEETVTLSSDIANKGPMVIENLDDTNYVQLGFATTVYYLRLMPGRPQLVELEPTLTQLFLKANTAACKVRFHALEA